MFDYFTNKGNDLAIQMFQTQYLLEVSENSNIQENSKVFYLLRSVHQ